VNKHGKIMIGWEEIAKGNIDSTVIVQHWHSNEMATMAAGKGARVIFSPATKVYLDMKYDTSTQLGLDWAALIEVSDGYSWDPAIWIDGLAPDKVVGIEAPLWSETLTNMDEVEYLAFPRLLGIAEKAWAATNDWNEYKSRLTQHGPRMSAMGINFYRSPQIAWP
jgi:hexosaminidase